METRDDLFQLGQSTYSGFFYKIASKNAFQIPEKLNKDYCGGKCISKYTIRLDPQQHMHKRRIYDILDLFSDVGGVTQLLVIVFTIILQPIFYHKQMLQIMK